MIRAGEDEFVAQVQHEHVRVASVERAVKGRVSLGGENNGGAGLANDPRGAMIRKGGFRAGDDLLSFVGEKHDEIGLLPLIGWFVEPA